MPASEVVLLLVGGGLTLGTQLATSLLNGRQTARSAEAETSRTKLQIEADQERERAAEALRVRAEVGPLLEEVGLLVANIASAVEGDVAHARAEMWRDPEAFEARKAAKDAFNRLELQLSSDHPLTLAVADCDRAAVTAAMNSMKSTSQAGQVARNAAATEDLNVVRAARSAYFRYTASLIGPTLDLDLGPKDEAEAEERRGRLFGRPT